MRVTPKTSRRQSGIALLTTILLMLLMSSLLVGFILMITSGQKLSGMNNDQSRAFYAAEAGMEKMTADIGSLFDTNYSPTGAEIAALQTTPPALTGINFVNYTGATGSGVSSTSTPFVRVAACSSNWRSRRSTCALVIHRPAALPRPGSQTSPESA